MKKFFYFKKAIIMKQSSIIILLTMFISMVGAKAFAHDIEVKNSDGVTIYYKWVNSNQLAVSFKGVSYQSSYSGDIVIPKSVEYGGGTYNVTEIGDQAFSGCKHLTSVSIPNTVRSIGRNAFQNCSNLTSVHISDLAAWCTMKFYYTYDGRYYTEISNPLSPTCHLFLNGEEINDLIIPDGVESISLGAFRWCKWLTSVSIPNTVERIGSAAFLNCSSMASITIPNSVTWLGDGAFSSCSKLESITIPNSVTHIGDRAFEGCSDLASITIPNSVTYVGIYAFKETAWYDNQSDGLVYAGSVAYEYKGTMPENTEIVIREGTATIGEGAFYNCSGLSSITIPPSVTYIGAKTFAGCSGLTSVHISDIAAWCGIAFGEHEVGSFDYCASNPLFYSKHIYIDGKEANDLIIPDGVSSIKRWAFYGCSGLTSVTIPNSVTKIGTNAFTNCSGLTAVYAYGVEPAEVTSYASRSRAYGSWVFEGVDKENCVLYVPKGSVEKYRDAWGWFTHIEEMEGTGICGLETDVKIYDVYNLSGRKVCNTTTSLNGLPKGVYIRNSKKVLVK